MGPAPVVQPPALPVRCLYLPLHMSLLRNVIAGARHPSTGSETFEIREPATGESSGHTPLSLAADVEAAAAAAARAFPEWRASPPVERARVLFRLKTLLDENKFDLMIWHALWCASMARFWTMHGARFSAGSKMWSTPAEFPLSCLATPLRMCQSPHAGRRRHARLYEAFPRLCPGCGAQMRILAFLTAAEPVDVLLGHLGLPTTPPPLSPARGPVPARPRLWLLPFSRPRPPRSPTPDPRRADAADRTRYQLAPTRHGRSRPLDR